jgi:hypothetical protein
MAIQMGPVLRFAGHDAKTGAWKLTALVVATTNPGPLKYGAAAPAIEAEIRSQWQEI